MKRTIADDLFDYSLLGFVVLAAPVWFPLWLVGFIAYWVGRGVRRLAELGEKTAP